MSDAGEPRLSGILAVVAEAAEGLVRSTFELPGAQPLLEALGVATGASRSYLFTTREDAGGAVVADLLLEWVAEGVESQISNPDLQGYGFDATGNRWLLDRLSAGEVVAGTREELPATFGSTLESQQIESILMTPILVRGGLWGLLGFDDCSAPRRWSEAEIGALRLASSLLAAAVERRDVEHGLRESEARYRALFEDSSDAVWAIDTEARFLALNRRAARLLGGEASELIGRSWAEFLPEDQLRHLDRLTDDSESDAGDTGWFELRLDAKAGEAPVWIEVRSRAVARGGGKVVGFQGTGRDVTARREVEQQLRRIERLEAWGRMAAGVARNFDGLMTTIRGYGERLVHDLRPTDPLRADAAEILLAADRAAELTRELVALGGAQPWRPERIDVSAWVEERLSMLRRLVGGEQGLSFESAPAVGAIEVDPELLEQALVALVMWLRDRHDEDLRIEIRAEPASGDDLKRRGAVDAAAGAYVRLRLADDGPAIGEETAGRLFEPLFVREFPETEGGGGGLATVYGIVRQCGGYLFADAGDDRGTRLDVYLPSIEAPEEKAPGEVSEGIREAPTILLVEDDELIRSLAEQILVGRGFRVLAADGASAALELAGAEKEPIDLLLTDIVMPGTSGVDLGQRLLRQHPSMKILYMSGYSESLVFRYGLFRDRSSLLRKPFSADDLERRVRELLGPAEGPSGIASEGSGPA